MSSKIVLCDIEGTTTSISFVKDNLFPYAAKNVETFLDAQWDAEDTKEAVRMLRDQSAADKRDNVDGCVEIVAGEEDKAKQIESIAANVKWQIEHDRKATPLKNLQGLMWVEAYKAGAFKGHVYEDVAPAFEAWTKAGWKTYVYSSGSAAIQKVHFEYSEKGDLAKYLSGYFDTKVGAKQEKASYEAIWKEISKEEEKMTIKDVLFLTDIPAEARAAKEAGMDAILLKRPGNGELTEEDAKTFKVVDTFADIPMGGAAEKEKETEEVAEKMIEDEATAPAIKRKIEDVGKEDVTPPAKLAKIDETAAPESTPVAADQPQIESKTEEETKDVPMESAVAAAVVDEVATEATEPAAKLTTPTVEPVTDEEEKTEEEETIAKPDKAEERMEVDSTTATAADNAAEKDQEKEKEDLKESKKDSAEEKTEKSEVDAPKEDQKESQTEKVAEEEEKEAQAAPEIVEEKKKVAEVEKAETEAMEKEKEPPAKKENGTSSSSMDGEEEKKEEDLVKKNGDSEVAQNGNGTEKEATNGHDDSDKENDKSMEAVVAAANPTDEVSTTSAPTSAGETPATVAVPADATSEAIAAAKKCAAIEPVSSAAPGTPIPAEVQAES